MQVINYMYNCSKENNDMAEIPRKEHPRPQMYRKSWINLNGKWQFEIDHGRSGKERELYKDAKLSSSIIVPFCPESKL